jgi:hypothetical protein
LPSPLLGLANLSTVDPPWASHPKTLVQQAALNQEEVVSSTRSLCRSAIEHDRCSTFPANSNDSQQITSQTSTRIDSFGVDERRNEQTHGERDVRIVDRVDPVGGIIRIDSTSIERRRRRRFERVLLLC